MQAKHRRGRGARDGRRLYGAAAAQLRVNRGDRGRVCAVFAAERGEREPECAVCGVVGVFGGDRGAVRADAARGM